MVGESIEGMKKRELLRSLIDANKVGDLMRKKFETVDPETALSDVVAKMKSSDLHEIPVVDGKKLVGVISYGAVIRKKNLVIGTKAKTMVETTPEINIDTPLTEVAEHFLSTGYRQLPVTKGKALLGIVTRANVISVLPKLKEIKALKIADVMSDSARSIHEKDLIKNAMSLMRDLEVRTVPVVDDQDRLVGIIGIRDIVQYSWTGPGTQAMGRQDKGGNNNPVEMEVRSLMHDSPITMTAEDDLTKAINTMVEKNISTIPVVSGDRMVGIVTKYDILELVASVRNRDMVYTQISGLDEEDRFSLEIMEKEMQSGLVKISKFTRPLLFTIHVSKYNNTGNRAKYSLIGRLSTENSHFMTKAVDWSLGQATVELMNNLDRIVKDKKEHNLDVRMKKNLHKKV
ncbi:MAG TPA: CBS domain-containing protein [Methanomassiliicoccales archaeon]|nr:CBS domain-containing protein [Methanomassiliicoccales archaeon]